MAEAGATAVQPEEAASKQQQQQQVQPASEPKPLFAIRPIPWWLCFFLGIFLLAKFQLVYNDSPCAILGTQGPVSSSDIKRAFRQLSKCTHPDKLRGRLKREPSEAEARRASMIFNRVSDAKDEIMKVLTRRTAGKKKKKKKQQQIEDEDESADNGVRIACYEGELEMAIFGLLAQAGIALSSYGLWNYVTLLRDFVWGICTLEAGVMSTVLSVLWFMFMYRQIKNFVKYLWSIGLLRVFVNILTTTIIGPLPTVFYFVALPFLRVLAFASSVWESMTARPADADFVDVADGKKDDGPEPEEVKTEPAKAVSSAKMAVATDKVDRNVLRQRKAKKETEEEKEKRNKELLLGESTAAKQAEQSALPEKDRWIENTPVPEGVWSCINWCHKEPVKARQAASAAVQFDVLLILTKPIIPLIMLISMGQVFNGLFSSIIIGHLLRQWVPTMGHETHHLLVSVFGMAHTLLGVTASQVEDHAAKEGALLHLKWAWSFKDVLCVMHMALLGSTVTGISGLGNEPSYAASFASGIALRIFLARDSVQGTSVMKQLGASFDAGLKDLGFIMESAEEAVAYSGDGIGDCGGGPFRMMFGEDYAAYWALALKAWLMIMPMLSTVQWAQRSLKAGRKIGRQHKMTRLVQRLTLAGLGLLQCYMICIMELNATNGALGNFWVAMLFGAVAESLLCTYDVRGQIKQLIFLLLFLLI